MVNFKLITMLLLSFILSSYKPLKEINFLGVQYVRNYDGDTVTVNIFGVHPLLGREIGIRIKDIDTPEIREGEKAIAAKIFLESLMESSEQIDLKGCTRGKYFRIVCDILVDGSCVSKMIIKEGHSKDLGVSCEDGGGTGNSKKWYAPDGEKKR